MSWVCPRGAVFLVVFSALFPASAAEAQLALSLSGGLSDPGTEPIIDEEDSEDKAFLPGVNTASSPDEDDADVESELALGDAEIRALRPSLVALSAGEAWPWQMIALEAGFPLGPQRMLSVFAGGGNFAESGARRSRGAANVIADARGFGVALRHYLERAPRISGQVALSWNTWSGRVEPLGAATDEADPGERLLPGSFRLTGLTLALAPALSRNWPNGFYFEWTPVGLRHTFRLSESYSRDTNLEGPVERWIFRTEVYGFINFKLGYAF